MTRLQFRRVVAMGAAFCGVWALAQTAPAADMAAAEIANADGEIIGKATFEQAPTGVIMRVKVSGLTPGEHGIHLHTVGQCNPDFTAAKGHINPEARKHGLRHPDGPDSGDLPNLFANADGSAQAEFFTPRVRVNAAAGADDSATPPTLLDEDGATVVIHANPDDHLTQPIGGAGGRVGCGVIKPVANAEPEAS